MEERENGFDIYQVNGTLLTLRRGKREDFMPVSHYREFPADILRIPLNLEHKL